jgi:hypothetical protein
MKKVSAFNEAKPRTPKGEARQREIAAMKAMGDLNNLDDEEEYKLALAEVWNPAWASQVFQGDRYLEGFTAREALSFLTRSTSSCVRAFFSASERPISSICSSRRRAIVRSAFLRESFWRPWGLGVGSADI